MAHSTLREPAGAAPASREPDTTVETSRRAYRLFAPVYDVVFGPGLQHGRRVAIDALECRAGDRVLDVCVGSGLSLPLYPPGVRVTGIDASHHMLRKAARRGNGSVQAPALLQMDAQRLAFADASFDKAVVLFAITGLPDPARAIREIGRVCRRGATIVIANRFRSERTVQRTCDALLSPLHRLLRYRTDVDLNRFLAASGLELVEARSANLWGYSTVLVCRNRAASRSAWSQS